MDSGEVSQHSRPDLRPEREEGVEIIIMIIDSSSISIIISSSSTTLRRVDEGRERRGEGSLRSQSSLRSRLGTMRSHPRRLAEDLRGCWWISPLPTWPFEPGW